jgi:hypothetical protein
MSEIELKTRLDEFDELRLSLWAQVKAYEEKWNCRIIIKDFDFVQIVNLRPDGQ